MTHETVDRIDEWFETHDGLDKAIVIAIVLTLLIAALTALGQTRALKRHDEAVSRADQWAVAATQASFRSDSVAQLQLDRFYTTQDARIRFELAQADQLLAVAPVRTRAEDQAQTWKSIYDSLQTNSGLLAGQPDRAAAGIAGEFADIERLSQGTAPDISESQPAGRRSHCPGARAEWPVQGVPGPVPETGPDSPQGDSSFPNRYLADTRRNAFYLQARGTLATEHAEGEEKEFTRLALSLTLFATAVFLFGFALSPYGKPHRPMYATGAVLLVIGSTVWGIRAAILTPSNERPAVADAYADGQVASYRGTDPGDQLTAATFYGCAKTLDRSFLPAYISQGVAWNSVVDPSDPTGAGNTELVARQYRRSAQQDFEVAAHDGALSPELPMAAGTDVFEAGLAAPNGLNRAKLEDGLLQEQQAADLLAGSPTLANLVTGTLTTKRGGATDRKAGAAKLQFTTTSLAFNIAEALLTLGRLRQADRAYETAIALARQQITGAGVDPQFYVQGALTDLLDVAAHTTRPSERRVHDHIQVEENAVVAGLAGQSGPKLSAHVARPVVFPGLLAFQINQSAVLTAASSLNAQWFYYLPKAKVWSAFGPGVSGPPLNVAPGVFFSPYLPTTVCLGSGKYMLQLYVNGQLVEQTIGLKVDLPKFVPAILPDMNVTVCRPPAWQRIPTGNPRPGMPTRLAGLADGYASSHHRQGLLVFDVSPEADVQQQGGSDLPNLLYKAIAQVHNWLPPDLRPLPGSGGVLFFAGTLAETTELYSYRGGILAAGIGTTGSGSVIVGVAYGPARVHRKLDLSYLEDLLASVIPTI